MNRTTIRRAAITAGLAATAVTALVGAAATGSAATSQGKDDLAVVRAATAKYHDVDVATEHGYIRSVPARS